MEALLLTLQEYSFLNQISVQLDWGFNQSVYYHGMGIEAQVKIC